MPTRKWMLLVESDVRDADLTLHTLASGAVPPAVVLARDAAQALDCIRGRNEQVARYSGLPALVLLELKLGKTDGWEVLRQIKGDARLAMIPVVVFTASRATADVVRCYRLGANAYVVKPTDPRQFAAVLDGIRYFWIAMNERAPAVTEPGASEAPQLAVAA